MARHLHINHKNFTLTWHSEKTPTQEQWNAFEKLAEKALEKLNNEVGALPISDVSESSIQYCSCTNECLGIYHKDRKCKKLPGYSR